MPKIIIIFTTRAYHEYDTFHSIDNDALIHCALDSQNAEYSPNSLIELNIQNMVSVRFAIHINFATR